MTDRDTEIRRLANGSIDTNYYVACCHRIRSHAAHRAISRAFRSLKAIFGIRQTETARAVERPGAKSAARLLKESHAPARLSEAA